MATTYGYGGEFSSDEDVDKLEQQQNERMIQAKFDNNLRPSTKQIEDTIEAIKRKPIEQEINLSDEMLAGLLDYFKTQRGPIVDSTRKLYNKIALRLIRGDRQPHTDNDNGMPTDTNGNLNGGSIVNDNNNSINLIHKAPKQRADTFSSDEDDDSDVFNRRTTAHTERAENKMDVDSVTPTGPARVNKQIDMSTTDEDADGSESSTDDTSELEELNSESDVMDVTPIKPPADQQSAIAIKEREGVEAVLAASRMTPRQPEASIRRQPLAQSTPKDLADTAKKPYTRSQRVATRSATRGKTSAESSAKSLDNLSSGTDAFVKNQRAPKKKFALIVAALFIAVLAFFLYYFKSSISSSTVPFLGPRIKF